jgi:hypothetical protein
MPLKRDEIKRRIEGARILRGISQAKLNELGAADGFGREEMGRVERGELDFRPGKHLDPLCRYLMVPRWWFTADELNFGSVDAPPSPDEVSSLLAQQTVLLSDIRTAVVEERQIRDEIADLIDRRAREIVEASPEDAPDPPPDPPPAVAAEKKPAAKRRTR